LKRRWSLLVFALFALGCGRGDGSATVRVTGNVTLDGAVIDVGTIDFVPLGSQQGRSTTAQIVEGAYEADVAPGRVRVYFHATRESGRTIEMFDQPTPERINVIPPHYQQGLEIEVDMHDTTHDFDLSADADGSSSR
jgi:hypothetical protein